MSEKELLEKGYRKYEGEVIDVFFNGNICKHAAKCVKGLPSVFNVDKKPWICLDGVNAEKLKEVIDSCPSGGLKYIAKE